jgi:Bacteriophage Lambda NinG protein
MLRTEQKMKVCEGCGSMFMPRASFATACRMVCARKVVNAKKKAEREELKARKEKLETIHELIKKAQHAFNAYIRERDRLAGYGCISSGRNLDWAGNSVDAGHYRSTGAASHLRFNEDNCHAQSKHDNQWKSGNAVDYRIGLIGRIGEARVLALEHNNEPHKWTHEELRSIRTTYVAKLKALKEK